MHKLLSIIGLTILTLMIGCTSQPPKTQSEDNLKYALDGHIFLDQPFAIENEQQVFALDNKMKAFLQTHISPTAHAKTKIVQLIKALLKNKDFQLKYEPSFTGTAKEVFYSGKANCLSFTLLFVAMSQQLGIKSTFNNVEVPVLWDLQGANTFVTYKHINAIIDMRLAGSMVVDLNLREYNQHYEQNTISKDQALAQYYNNKGVELMYEQKDDHAFQYLKKGLLLDPKAGFIWSNLGTLYKRHNDFKGSEIAYLQALHHNKNNLVAISGLQRLYEKMGNIESSQHYQKLAKHFRESNPYYHYWLASSAFKNKQYSNALTFINRAISKQKKEHRFHFLKGLTLLQSGNQKAAKKSFKQAQDYAQNERTRERYQSKFERLLP